MIFGQIETLNKPDFKFEIYTRNRNPNTINRNPIPVQMQEIATLFQSICKKSKTKYQKSIQKYQQNETLLAEIGQKKQV